MLRPKRPVPGQSFPKNYFPELHDFVMSLVPHSDRKTMRISWTRHGVQFSALNRGGGEGGGAGGGGGGVWGEIKTVTDSNNYTADIWSDRENEDPDEEGVELYVRDIVDELAVGDFIKVVTTSKEDYDYENENQLGDL